MNTQVSTQNISQFTLEDLIHSDLSEYDETEDEYYPAKKVNANSTLIYYKLMLYQY